MYESMREWLKNLDSDEPDDEYINSKPYQFMMDLIPKYVNENIDSLSDTELNEITKFYSEYSQKKLAD